MCLAGLPFRLLFGVKEEVNSGEFFEVRHMAGSSPLSTFSEYAWMSVLCGLLYLLGILIFLGSGLVSLVKLLACLLLSLSGRIAKIDHELYSFVGGFLLITKFGRLFTVFIVLRLFFDSGHWLFFLLIRCDHDRLCVFLEFWYARRFVHASLATFCNFFLSVLSLFIAVRGRLIGPRKFYVFALFVVLAQVVRNSEGFFVDGLLFGCVVR